MKIYKFKDLTDEEKLFHFYQIVLDNTIWCAKPDSFNDENEFKFKLDYDQSPSTVKLLYEVVTKYGNHSPPELSALSVLTPKKLKKIVAPIIVYLIENCRNTIGVVSFSVTKTDNRLWDKYGGNGNGVCIEINIPDDLIGKSYHHVRYVSEKIFHVDSFLESTLSQDGVLETYRNILLTKTEEWSREQEVRFIGNRQEVNLKIDGYISEVTFGAQVPAEVVAKIANHCNTNNITIITLL